MAPTRRATSSCAICARSCRERTRSSTRWPSIARPARAAHARQPVCAARHHGRLGRLHRSREGRRRAGAGHGPDRRRAEPPVHAGLHDDAPAGRSVPQPARPCHAATASRPRAARLRRARASGDGCSRIGNDERGQSPVPGTVPMQRYGDCPGDGDSPLLPQLPEPPFAFSSARSATAAAWAAALDSACRARTALVAASSSAAADFNARSDSIRLDFAGSAAVRARRSASAAAAAASCRRAASACASARRRAGVSPRADRPLAGRAPALAPASSPACAPTARPTPRARRTRRTRAGPDLPAGGHARVAWRRSRAHRSRRASSAAARPARG